MSVLLVLIILLLLGLIGVMGFYLYRFVTCIIIIENDLSEALEVLNRSKDTMEGFLTSNNLIVDSPHARAMLNECLEDVKMCKLATQTIIDKFTRLSKKKYIQVVEGNELVHTKEVIIEDETWA